MKETVNTKAVLMLLNRLRDSARIERDQSEDDGDWGHMRFCMGMNVALTEVINAVEELAEDD